jgi:hypothetical protein
MATSEQMITKPSFSIRNNGPRGSAKQKDRPKAVSLQRLIKAEIRATRTLPSPILLPSPSINLRGVSSEVEGKDLFRGRN